VMFVVGLSLSGVFTLGGGGNFGQALAAKSGPLGDFFTGALACVVASPCIAPFMGGALAYALTAPAGLALLVFLTLGLGLALPFVLIAFIPALAGRLPKPGAWMETLKQFLAFPMYLTALWLLWILLMMLNAAGMVVLALGLWMHERGRWQGWPLARALALPLLVIALALTPVGYLFSDQNPQPAQLRRSQIAHEPTADWCVTCKLNEVRVLRQRAFKQALDAAGAVYMLGDWTDEDPAISAFLERHHAVGVPLYVVYPADGGEVRVLPAILNLDAVEAALGGGGG